MVLTFDQIEKLIHGAARIEKCGDSVHLNRLTKAQEELIGAYHTVYLGRAQTTAGISLEMDTDSENLTLTVKVRNAFRKDRSFAHSILVNGGRIGELRGEAPDGDVEMEGKFSLGEGFKRVQIIFPWSADSAIKMLEVDDGATVHPVVKQRKMLIFGDSITQGYHTHHPENAYTVQLAQYLDASAINKSIGGIKYYPPLAQLPDAVTPDVILVSYGGNDWHGGNKSEFEQDSVLFCGSLREQYPNAKIIVMMPFCARSRERNEPHWRFAELQQHLRELPEKIDNLIVMESSDFVPKDPVLFHSDGVHPLDEGHICHYQNIVNALEQMVF